MSEAKITFNQALVYEIRASKWTAYISNDWLQDQVAKYFSWKVSRKYNSYKQMNDLEERVKTQNQPNR